MPPDASQVTVCPSCGEDTLKRHCWSPTCGWLRCTSKQCKSFGIPGWRWCDMRKLSAA